MAQNYLVIKNSDPMGLQNQHYKQCVEEVEVLTQQKLKIVNQVSWHGGLPFYRVKKEGVSGMTYDIAEFYLKI